MSATRSLSSLLVGALMLSASTANAANYSFAGKFTSNRGKIINIPMVGNTPCTKGNPGAPGAKITLMTGPGTGMSMTPAVHMIVRGANTQPMMSVTPNFNATGMDLLCVKQKAGVPLVTNASGLGTAMGKGGGFVMPNNAFSKPFVGKIRAVEVKYVVPVLQLATSFKITGPAAMRTTLPGGRQCVPGMLTGMGKKICGTQMINTMGTVTAFMTTATNIAPFHRFVKSAWKGGPAMTFKGHTGRVGAMFTWCPLTGAAGGGKYFKGNGGSCAATPLNPYPIIGAQPNIIVKYSGGGNAFGGTMAYLITTGPNVSSLALGPPITGLPNPAVFQKLSGMGSQPTGRGYADFLTDYLDPGPVWGNHARKTVTPSPTVGPQKLITKVSIPVGNGSVGYNYNWGFPLTTMTVLVRNTGPQTTTLTAKGSDMRATPTAMGNRNLSLVAGGMAQAVLAKQGAVPPTPEILTMFLPEPGGTVQMLAGVAGLLAIAAWRARKVR